jgi:cell pole-organizing protein PopZ
MAQAAKSQEPSMEEILASIRRIIAEDDAEKPPQHPAQTTAVEFNPNTAGSALGTARAKAEPFSVPRVVPQENPSATVASSRSSTILDLTEPLAASASRAAAAEVDSSPSSPDPIERAQADEAVSAPQPSAAGENPGGGLISSATGAAVDSAFNALAQTVLVHNARTLEDLVREMLRPMLKVWLDDNLPGMVERLVRAEIERVSRGRG